MTEPANEPVPSKTPDFSNLAAMEVQPGATAWLELPWLGDDVAIQCAPATEANDEFLQWLLTDGASAAAAEAAGPKRKLSPVEQHRRDRERQRYPMGAFCIRGWRGVRDVGGNDVPWSRENGAAFAKALPASVFDIFRLFVLTPSNFGAALPAEAAEAVSGKRRRGSSGS